MTEVNKPAIQEWVTALRSGVYTQGTGSLHRIVETPEGSENQFCCLGVACDLFKDRAGVETSIDDGDETVRYDGDGGFLPGRITNYLGLPAEIPFVTVAGTADVSPRTESVAYLNDEKGWSFNQIADAIERTYLTCDYNTGYGLPGVAKCGKPAVGKWHETDDEWFCAEHMNPQDGE